MPPSRIFLQQSDRVPLSSSTLRYFPQWAGTCYPQKFFQIFPITQTTFLWLLWFLVLKKIRYFPWQYQKEVVCVRKKKWQPQLMRNIFCQNSVFYFQKNFSFIFKIWSMAMIAFYFSKSFEFTTMSLGNNCCRQNDG